MSRKRCVVAVTENGGTRCGSTTAFTGSGGIPCLLMKWASDEDGNSLFDNMRLQTEISLEQYQGYLDHPENADDLSAMAGLPAGAIPAGQPDQAPGDESPLLPSGAGD